MSSAGNGENMGELRDHEIVTFSRLALSLATDYESIYYINANDSSYVEYGISSDEHELTVLSLGDDFFADVIRDVPRLVYKDDRAAFLETFTKENLFSQTGSGRSFMHDYRLVKDGRTVYYQLKAIRGTGIDSDFIIVGVKNVDEQVRREMAARQESETYGQIVKALAKRYEVIFYVDLDTNSYQDFTSSEKYLKLKQGVPGKDFFEDMQRSMKRDVYHEDYPVMAKVLDKQQFVSDLEDNGTISLTYRLMLEGRPQYVTFFAIRPEDDTRHVIVAVSNIDSAKQKEMAIRAALGNAMDMANKDALTKVKNKYAYTKAVKDLNEQAARGAKEFAVVVMDINGLKHVNDTQGHSSGDEYIKESCHIICTIFKHSPVFRIGGDEFAVLLTGQDYENREELIGRFKSIVMSNKKKGLANLACGMATFDRGLDSSVESVFERADKAMYENKRLFKGMNLQ